MSNNGFPENRDVKEIMWKYTAQRDRAQMSIRRMRIACWIIKATDTHSEYVTFIAFPRQQWLRHLPSILYVHCLSFYNRDGVCLLRGTS